LEEGASRTEVDALGHDLEAHRDVAEVRYVSPGEAYVELRKVLGDVPGAHPVPRDSLAATFRIETVDESAARRIERMTGPAIARIRSSLEARRVLCRNGLQPPPAP
ncbi:MAG: permease-like cell division protein FtsX, partial [Actinomycetota bacterium]|nr:permease-like cell division protein FtsX [Actinomycetota bacterium]